MPIDINLSARLDDIGKRLCRVWNAIPIPNVIMEEPLDFEERDDQDFLSGKSFDTVSETDWIKNAKTFTSLTANAARYYLGAYLLRVICDLYPSETPFKCRGLPDIVLVSCLLNADWVEPVAALMSAEERILVSEIITLLIDNHAIFRLQVSEIKGLERRRDLLGRGTSSREQGK